MQYNDKKTTLLFIPLLLAVVFVTGRVIAASPYAPNVTVNQSSSVTITGGTGNVDDSNTGVSVTISGAAGIPSVTVTTEDLNSPSSGVTTFSTSGVYFDVQVTVPAGDTVPADATDTVCFTDAGLNSGDTLDYWTGSAWASASNISISGTQICGTVPLSALTGTNFVVAAAAANYTLYYIAAIVVALVVIIAVGVILTRRKKA